MPFYKAALLAVGFSLHHSHAVIAPPPPPGPPPAVLIGVSIAGPEYVDEGDSAQYICTAQYSDGSLAQVSASWSENSDSATISVSGELFAGAVVADQAINVMVEFEGAFATNVVVVKDVPVVLTGLEIDGPSVMDEESSAQYVCLASYSDGTSTLVSPAWSENSESAEVSETGLFSAGNVSADQTVILTASLNGFSDEYLITITYVPPVLTGISILGPTTVDEETTSSFVCIASYSDGSSAAVDPSWAVNSGIASISSTGVLSTGNIESDQSVVVSASFDGALATHTVAVNYVAPTLLGVSVAGPSIVDEKSVTQFVCTATYSDGTSGEVTPSWSIDSLVSSISPLGELSAGDVLEDESLVLTALFEGQISTFPVVVRVADKQVIYPLSGFAGKMVRAELWDHAAQQLLPLTESDSPDELVIENLSAEQWYWLSIQEFSDLTGEWIPVHENWLNM
jgi:hypothetical protein